MLWWVIVFFFIGTPVGCVFLGFIGFGFLGLDQIISDSLCLGWVNAIKRGEKEL